MTFAGSPAQAQAQQITGGYAKTGVGGKEVRAAAKFAVAELQKRPAAKLELLLVKQAASQVVAGTNYKLCLRVKVNGKKQIVGATVYKNLQSQYKLIEAKIGSCQT